jgi:hypothetical protein
MIHSVAEQQRWITVQGEPPRADALTHALQFPPPLAHLSSAPENFTYWWHLLQFVFELPDPAAFPPLREHEKGDLPVARRYVATCRELAESSVLAHRGGIAVRDTGEGVMVTSDLPTKEAMRGTDVLFRQIQSSEEPASYAKVRKIIGRRIHEAPDDGHRDRRQEWQRRWRAAHGRLNTYLLTYLADAKALGWPDAHLSNPPAARSKLDERPGEDVKPMLVLSLFRYGDFIHWGDRREDFALLAQDDHGLNFAYMDYLEVLLQLSHFYIGYSVLAAAAFGLETA